MQNVQRTCESLRTLSSVARFCDRCNKEMWQYRKNQFIIVFCAQQTEKLHIIHENARTTRFFFIRYQGDLI